MSKVLCEKSDLVAIADSVRSKTGTTGGMKVSEIPQKIEAIETGSNVNLQEKALTITSNGTTTVTPDTGYDALGKVDVTVNVAGGGGSSSETWVLNDEAYLFNNEATTFSANFTSNGLFFSSIILSVNLRRQILYDSTLIKEFNAWTSQAYRKLTFDAPPTGDLLTWLQANGVKQANNTVMQPEKTLTITSNGTITITPDVPYDALKKVSVQTNIDPYNTETTETVTCTSSMCTIYGMFLMSGNDGNKIIAPHGYSTSELDGAKILKGSHITFPSTLGGISHLLDSF